MIKSCWNQYCEAVKNDAVLLDEMKQQSKLVFIEHAQLATWAFDYLLYELQKRGIFGNTRKKYGFSELVNILQVCSRHESQLQAILEIFIRRKIITITNARYSLSSDKNTVTEATLLQEQEKLLVKSPVLTQKFQFIKKLLQDYLYILSGKASLLLHLFPSGGFNVLEMLYALSPEAAYYNQVVSLMMLKFITHLATVSFTTHKIRVLEIGAGIGATSVAVLELLDGINLRYEYHYTDISLAFLHQGKKKLMMYKDDVKFSQLNIDALLEDNSLPQFDVVIASNCLHNATSLTEVMKGVYSLLKRNGVLIINEGVRKCDFSTLIYGLATGWWNARHCKIRMKGSPLISTEKWLGVLVDTGFSQCVSFGELTKEPGVNQDVILAHKL